MIYVGFMSNRLSLDLHMYEMRSIWALLISLCEDYYSPITRLINWDDTAYFPFPRMTFLFDSDYMFHIQGIKKTLSLPTQKFLNKGYYIRLSVSAALLRAFVNELMNENRIAFDTRRHVASS